MNFGSAQLELGKKSRDYIKKINKQGIDTGKSIYCYFAGWDESLGLCKLRFWNGEFPYTNYIKLFLKEIWGIYNHQNYVLENNFSKNSFKNLIITWGNKSNFLINGSLQDNYFQTNSRKVKNSLWFVIYFGDNLPKKIDKNIVIFKKDKNNLSFFYLIKTIFKILIKNNFNFNKIIHSLSSHAVFSDIINHQIKSYITEKKLRKIIMPYEAQPFQQTLISKVKKINKKIKIIGYAHDAEPLQLHLQFRKGSPDTMLFHTKSRIKYYNKYLNWPLSRLKFVPSLRFRKGANEEISDGNILLPHGVYQQKKILIEFEKFLKISNTNTLSKFKVRCHPAAFNLKIQNNLKTKIENLMDKYQDKFWHKSKGKKKKMLVVIGLSSSVIIALEKGLEVYQICMEPIFQSYSEKIWPNIQVSQLSTNIFKYNLKKFGKCIKFGNEKNMFNKYCVN